MTLIFVTLKIAGDDRQEKLVQQYLSVYLVVGSPEYCSPKNYGLSSIFKLLMSV